MKKVFVVGIVGLPACYGGFETLVENLVEQSDPAITYTVFCSKSNYTTLLSDHKGAKLQYLPLKANGAQSVLYDILSLLKTLYQRPDVVLVLGVSGGLFLPFFKLLSRSKVIVNIDGLEWRRAKWGRLQRAFLKFSERAAVRFSDAVISDNQAIYEYVLNEYGHASHVIAYGGDHAVTKPISGQGQDFALALCRIEPENNVEMILEAFSILDMPLRFIGNWDNSSFGRQLKAKFGDYPHIDLIDPIYAPEQLFEFRDQCRVYIHGHSAGGTNPSLVEMMFFAKPIIAYDCDFNRFTTDSKARYFDSSVALQKVIEETLSEPNVLIGKNMQSIAKSRYTWEHVARLYRELY